MAITLVGVCRSPSYGLVGQACMMPLPELTQAVVAAGGRCCSGGARPPRVQYFARVAMNFAPTDPRPVMLSNPGLVFRITLPVKQ